MTASYERERALGHGKKPVTDIIVLDDVGIILTLCGTHDAFNLKAARAIFSREIRAFIF